MFLLKTQEIYLVLLRTHINPKVVNGLKKERKRKNSREASLKEEDGSAKLGPGEKSVPLQCGA